MPNIEHPVSSRLHRLGIHRGDIVAIQSENCSQFAEIVFSCWQLGAVIFPISVRYPDAKVKRALEDYNTKIFLASRTFYSSVKKMNCFPIEEVAEGNNKVWTPTPYKKDDFDLQADASVILTSGSIAKPRAVLHTLENHYYSALGAHHNIPFERGDQWLASLPMYHISGFSLVTRALLQGGTLVFQEPKQSLAESIQQNNITHLSLVPAQLIKLLEDTVCIQKLQAMKMILLGGAPIPSTLIHKAMILKLPIYRTYGSTEMASQITTTSQKDGYSENNSAGRPLKYRQVRIAADGEIQVKGQTLFRGYLENGLVISPVDEDGFFSTGDTGFFDKDNQLHITGRKNLMFISGGENIYPQEIEDALTQIDDVEQAVVVPVEDGLLGERPVAFIKSKGGRLDESCIKDSLKAHIEKFKIPKNFLPWPEEFDSLLKPSRSEFQAYATKLFQKKPFQG